MTSDVFQWLFNVMKFPLKVCLEYTSALEASEVESMEDLRLFYERKKDFKWSTYGIVAAGHTKQMDAFLKDGQ